MIGTPGLPELLIFAVVILLVFGKRLPTVMRSIGSSIVEFKKGVQGVEDDVRDAERTEVGSSVDE